MGQVAHHNGGLTIIFIMVSHHKEEAQVDWYEAVAILGDEATTLQVFCLRSMASGAAFHRAYPRATQQAFLEAHEDAFAYFGGTFTTLRYDNLTSAVRKILRGFRREETTRFLAFRSHWQFAAEFCTPGEGHEKGGVEGEAGYFRRNHWVPLPKAAHLDALNAYLLDGCRADEQRVMQGRTQSVGEAMTIEHASLRPLATERFDLHEVSFTTVDGARAGRLYNVSKNVRAAAGVASVSTRPKNMRGRYVTASRPSRAAARSVRTWTPMTCDSADNRSGRSSGDGARRVCIRPMIAGGAGRRPASHVR
jgi:hypothetical protein